MFCGSAGWLLMNILLKDVVKKFGTLEAVSHISLEIRMGNSLPCWDLLGAERPPFCG